MKSKWQHLNNIWKALAENISVMASIMKYYQYQCRKGVINEMKMCQ